MQDSAIGGVPTSGTDVAGDDTRSSAADGAEQQTTIEGVDTADGPADGAAGAEAVGGDTAELERVRRELEAVREHLPRIVLVEAEYALAHLETDVAWIAGLLDDLHSGALSWAYEDLIDTARRAATGGEDPP